LAVPQGTITEQGVRKTSVYRFFILLHGNGQGATAFTSSYGRRLQLPKFQDLIMAMAAKRSGLDNNKTLTEDYYHLD